MRQREDLSEMFDYDRWANSRWLDPAKALGAEDVLLHIVQAQVIWLCRIEGTQIWKVTLPELPLHMERIGRGWRRFLLGADFGQVVQYQNFQGEHCENTISEIVRHVINHGTYHRGHLRGMAEERGLEFPETDFIAYVREQKGLAGGGRRSVAGVL